MDRVLEVAVLFIAIACIAVGAVNLGTNNHADAAFWLMIGGIWLYLARAR